MIPCGCGEEMACDAGSEIFFLAAALTRTPIARHPLLCVFFIRHGGAWFLAVPFPSRPAHPCGLFNLGITTVCEGYLVVLCTYPQIPQCDRESPTILAST